MIYDLDLSIYEKSLYWPFSKEFKAARASVITTEEAVYWSQTLDASDLKIDKVRILVCGPSGVGKSTLVNKTFGREVVSYFPQQRVNRKIWGHFCPI
jgi:putative ribosome biogenesis GTPase RsgA